MCEGVRVHKGSAPGEKVAEADHNSYTFYLRPPIRLLDLQLSSLRHKLYLKYYKKNSACTELSTIS